MQTRRTAKAPTQSISKELNCLMFSVTGTEFIVKELLLDGRPLFCTGFGKPPVPPASGFCHPKWPIHLLLRSTELFSSLAPSFFLHWYWYMGTQITNKCLAIDFRHKQAFKNTGLRTLDFQPKIISSGHFHGSFNTPGVCLCYDMWYCVLLATSHVQSVSHSLCLLPSSLSRNPKRDSWF